MSPKTISILIYATFGLAGIGWLFWFCVKLAYHRGVMAGMDKMRKLFTEKRA